MRILETMTSTINNGQAAAQRGVQITKIKNQINDLERKRKSLLFDLGNSLYEVTKNLDEFRQGREQLYDDIAAIDSERAALNIDLKKLIDPPAPSEIKCDVCGTIIRDNYKYCPGCATPIDKPKPLDSTKKCPICGHNAKPDDHFCMMCGFDFEGKDINPMG